ncbi:FeoA domain-containing protein [Caldanaerobacter subterraneus]|uniref:Iron transporter FeoA n=1 Tax=Caldanaerobacter subterraneus TaxID=911092 RepID=A0A7Y2PLW2_9THEO|nr:iron transporter FeoA [Caldanaerobacter subterraneus]
MEWLKVLKEDVLRFLKEKEGNKSTLEEIAIESKVDKEDVIEAVKSLEKDNFVNFEKQEVYLTEDGKKEAESIYEKHNFVESLYGHQIAHALEHYAMKDMKKAFESASSPKKLKDFKEQQIGFVVRLSIDNPMVLSRIIGLGLAPGSYFKIVKKRDDFLVIESHGRLVVLGGEIGDNIEGVEALEDASGRTA